MMQRSKRKKLGTGYITLIFAMLKFNKKKVKYNSFHSERASLKKSYLGVIYQYGTLMSVTGCFTPKSLSSKFAFKGCMPTPTKMSVRAISGIMVIQT